MSTALPPTATNTMHTAAAATRKTVLITGVSRGLGNALALELAKLGQTVIGCSRSQDKLASLESELTAASEKFKNNNHLVLNIDVRSDAGVKELARTVVEKKVVPDIIVNNAGTINRNNKIWDVPVDEFDAVVDTNIKGVANVLRHFTPLMIGRKQGVIVNMSSGWGRSAAAQIAPTPSSSFRSICERLLVLEYYPFRWDLMTQATEVAALFLWSAHFTKSWMPLQSRKEKKIRKINYQVAPYCASKWAIEGLTRAVAKELPPGMAIVALSPGVINTEMLQSCFGSSADLYPTPESWAPKAASMILNLTVADNGASLTV